MKKSGWEKLEDDSNNCPFERTFMAQPALLSDCSSLADVNECLTGLAMCAHRCLNTQGSFKCTCNPGYELGADGKRCYREYCGWTPAAGGDGRRVHFCGQVFAHPENWGGGGLSYGHHCLMSFPSRSRAGCLLSPRDNKL